MLTKKNILGLEITNAKREEILEYIVDSLKKKSKTFYIVTPNPEMVVFGQKNPKFQEIINKAEIASADGVGLIIAGQILGNPLQERVTGVDLMDDVCREVAHINLSDTKKPITVGFLGGRGNIAELTAKCLSKKYPGLKIVFTENEWPDKSPTIHIDMLFVAFGFPKQEYFMSEHVGKIPVTAMMGVGGAFDYISGNVKRAPYLIRAVGLEWLFRLINEPWRAGRQLALISFVILTIKQKFTS